MFFPQLREIHMCTKETVDLWSYSSKPVQNK